MTAEEMKQRLKMIAYYDGSNAMCRENIRRKYPIDRPEALQIWTEMIERNESRKAQALSLLDYAADETDREMLYMRYVQGLSPYDIADNICYCYSHSARKFSKALKRLAENVKEIPPFPF